VCIVESLCSPVPGDDAPPKSVTRCVRRACMAAKRRNCASDSTAGDITKNYDPRGAPAPHTCTCQIAFVTTVVFSRRCESPWQAVIDRELLVKTVRQLAHGRPGPYAAGSAGAAGGKPSSRTAHPGNIATWAAASRSAMCVRRFELVTFVRADC